MSGWMQFPVVASDVISVAMFGELRAAVVERMQAKGLGSSYWPPQISDARPIRQIDIAAYENAIEQACVNTYFRFQSDPAYYSFMAWDKADVLNQVFGQSDWPQSPGRPISLELLNGMYEIVCSSGYTARPLGLYDKSEHWMTYEPSHSGAEQHVSYGSTMVAAEDRAAARCVWYEDISNQGSGNPDDFTVGSQSYSTYNGSLGIPPDTWVAKHQAYTNLVTRTFDTRVTGNIRRAYLGIGLTTPASSLNDSQHHYEGLTLAADLNGLQWSLEDLPLDINGGGYNPYVWRYYPVSSPSYASNVSSRLTLTPGQGTNTPLYPPVEYAAFKYARIQNYRPQLMFLVGFNYY